MRIIVCIKQVPAHSKVEVDPVSGTLKRVGQSTKTNPYNLFAIEAALRLRTEAGGTVTALTMGPRQADAMMSDAYRMGVDDAVVLSDQKFAGSDVLATSYTLSQGITVTSNYHRFTPTVCHCQIYGHGANRRSHLSPGRTRLTRPTRGTYRHHKQHSHH